MIHADELAKMTDDQFLRYIVAWALQEGLDFWRLLVQQNARRMRFLCSESQVTSQI